MIQKYDLSPICFRLMKYNLQVQLVSERSKYLRRKTVQMDLNTILVSILHNTHTEICSNIVREDNRITVLSLKDQRTSR